MGTAFDPALARHSSESWNPVTATVAKALDDQPSAVVKRFQLSPG